MRRLSMAQRFQIGAGFSILILIFLGFTVFYQFLSLNDKIQRILDSDLSLMEFSEQTEKLVENFRNKEIYAFMDGQQASFTELLSYLDNLKRHISRGKALGTLASESVLVFLRKLDQYAMEIKKFSLFIPSERVIPYYKLSLRHTEILSILDEFNSPGVKHLQMRKDSIASIGKAFQIRVAIISSFVIIIAIALSLFFSGQISLPLRRIKDLIEQIRDGNYELLSRHQSNDEAGQIFSGLTKMAEHILIRDKLKIAKISIEKQRFGTLANYLQAPVFLLNEEMKMAFANNYFLEQFRLSWDDIFESEWGQTPLPPELKTRISEAITRENWLQNEEMDLIGESYAYEVSISILPVKDSNGKIVSYVCLLKRVESVIGKNKPA